jgi:hypothetical protein
MTQYVGNIDERGYLNSFRRKGFTPEKCLLELFANSLDSNATMVTYNICPKCIYMIDNGTGMNREHISNMFSMQRENHTGHARCGVSGLGGKVAMYNLSNQTHVCIFTRMCDGEYLCVDVPWDKIDKDGIYTGQVSIREMTEQEQTEFNLNREKHGTTIKFINNPSLRETILNSFSKIEGNPLDRTGVIFGRMQIKCNCMDYEEREQTLEWYNPFNQEEHEFYLGKRKETIEVFKHKDKTNPTFRFICNGHEIKPFGKGFSKDVSKVQDNCIDYEGIGKFEIVIALPVNDKLFDRTNPCLPQHASADIIRDIDKHHLGDDCLDFLSAYKLYRNNQLIGLIPPPDIKLSSIRGNAKSFTEHGLLQCIISFNPLSNHDNFMDYLMNIQENKNQFDGTSITKQLTRLIASIKRQHFDRIWEYFEDKSKPEVREELPADPAPRLEPEYVAPEVVEVREELPSDPAPRLEIEDEYMEPIVELVSPPALRLESEYMEPVAEVHEELLSDPTPRLTLSDMGFDSGEYVAPPAAVVLCEESHEVHIDPVDVSSHRRGCFHGHEMIEQLERLKQLFHHDNVYVDEKDIKLFNILRSYA